MKRYLTCLLPFVALAMLAATPACSSDDDDDDNPGTQGSAGASGKAGSGGNGGGAPGGSGGAGGGGGGGPAPLPPAKPASYDVLALGEASTLYYFKSDAPETVKVGVIDGADADFEAIDVRSSDGLIYGITSDGKLYKIDVDTSGEDLAATASGGDAVDGFVTGQGGIAFDFNPKSAIAADKGGDGGNALRVITDEANYRLNPANSSIAGTDTALAYKAADDNEGQTPQIVAAGYLNSYKGTASTVLYDIDTTTDSLVQQGDPDPNLGVLLTIGSLGIDLGEEAGFDIVTSSDNGSVVNEAFLVHDGTFYSVNLGTGAASEVGDVDGATGLKGLVVMVP